MKKIIALIMCTVMMLSVNLNVFAAADTKEMVTKGTEEIPLSVEYKESTTTESISLNITWSDMKIKYNESVKEWNSETLKYDVVEEGGWKSYPTLTLENRSNVDLDITVTTAISSEYAEKGIGLSWQENDCQDVLTDSTVPSAEMKFKMYSVTSPEKTNPNAASKIEFLAEFSGDMEAALGDTVENLDNISIGTIEITIK